MYRTFVAIRYLRRNRLNLVGILAVFLAVLVMICVLSVMKGFDQEFRASIHATLSDLIVDSWSSQTFPGYEAMMEKIERIPHVEACSPHYEGFAVMRLGDTDLERQGVFHGIDLERELKTTDFAEYWRAARGADAREALQRLLAPGNPGLDVMLKDSIIGLLSQLRTYDFELLSRSQRRAIRVWTEEQGESLQALLAQAEAALPQWGEVPDPVRHSPCFAGNELAVLGRDLSGRSVSLGEGDRITVVALREKLDDPGMRRCFISGKFRSGLYEYDQSNLYVPLADVQDRTFMDKGEPPEVTSINIRLDSFDNAPFVRAALIGILTPAELAEGVAVTTPFLGEASKATLPELKKRITLLRRNSAKWFAEGGRRAVEETIAVENLLTPLLYAALESSKAGNGALSERKALATFSDKVADRRKNCIGQYFRVNTWEDRRRTFLRAVGIERRAMGVIVFFVMLVAGFLVLSILHTTVVLKTKDIGILKSIGGSVRGIMSIFLLNGLLMGVTGAGLGAAGGLLITRNIDAIQYFLEKVIGFSVFPSEIYYLDRLPVDKDPFWSIMTICLSAIVVSFLASAYPAWKASRMDPVEALRHE